MEVKFDVQTVALGRGIMTAYQLQKALDSYPSEAAKLWNGQVKQVSLVMLKRLCEALQCEPGELFVKTDEDKPKKKGKTQ